MSRIIGVLQRLGEAGTLAGVSPAEAAACLPVPERAAVLACDAAALSALLGARASLACSVSAPEHEPPAEEQPDQRDEPTDLPQDDEAEAA